MRVWLLTDDRAGNINQVLGVAEALGCPFERKEMRYDKWIRLPNFLRGSTLTGLDDVSKERIKAPWPDLVIGAGRRIFPVALYIKKQNPSCKIVQLMNPGKAGFSKADLVVIPAHDKGIGNRKNILRVQGAPHRITPEKLALEKEKWMPFFEKYASPRVSVIIGGTTKNGSFSEKMAQRLIEGLLSLDAGSFLITTSRRTPPDVIRLFKERLPKEKTYLYEFGQGEENPYFGLLACADKVVVTGDSMSMCSEACAAGVPVFIFAPKGMFDEKHERLHSALYRGGYATELSSGQVAFGGRLNASKIVAEKIKDLFKGEQTEIYPPRK